MKHYACFSAAIRDGAKLREQGRGSLFRSDTTCAIGAGLEAIGGEELLEVALKATDFYAGRLFPYLETESKCPEAECTDESSVCDSLTNLIWHLNDYHYWTREQIADWLDAKEEKLGFTTLVESEAGAVHGPFFGPLAESYWKLAWNY